MTDPTKTLAYELFVEHTAMCVRVGKVMSRRHPELPALHWDLEHVTSLVGCAPSSQFGTTAGTAVQEWADALGLAEVADAGPGRVEYAGLVSGARVRLWAVVDQGAWDAAQ